MTSKILTATAPVGGAILKIDTIEHEGQLWLVPHWLVMPDGRSMKPLRMISLATVQHQLSNGSSGWDVVVNSPIPKSVLDQGFAPDGQAQHYIILESPDISFPNPDVKH